eukprot:gene18575-25084_t
MASTGTSVAPGLAPGLARKVKKILGIKTESPELINSLNTLSGFYTDNSPAARRSMRSTVEKKGLEINEQFIMSAESVMKALDTVQNNLDGLSSSCSRITEVLATTKASAAPLLTDSEQLQKNLEQVDKKSALINDFLEQYQLSPEEVDALQGEDVGSPAFFAALARVRVIHDNCRALLRTHHQRAGLELMDHMATYQETAYERLCRWVQGECRNIALKERPVLFKYCAEEVATARHNALFQRFITALTRGGPGGMPRPIEIHAHDPKRYINDMMAWVHQSLAGEREFVVALFGDDDRSTSNGGASDDDLTNDGMSASGLLDRVFESICRPLRVRIEQVLMTAPPLLLCFQLSQLHAFYYGLVTRIIGPHAQLAQVLRGCRDMANRVFFEQLKARGDKLLRSPPPPPKDLTPPQQVVETVHQLMEIINAHESALESNPDPASSTDNSEGDEFVGSILSAVVDPLAEMCERSAEALTPDAPSRVDEISKIDPCAHRIYLINCLSSVTTALSHRPTAQLRSRQLADMVEGHMSALVGGEAGRLLARCGLAEIVERMRLYQMNKQGPEGAAVVAAADGGLEQVPASDPALSLPNISEAMRQFFVLVSTPDALPEFRGILLSSGDDSGSHGSSRRSSLGWVPVVDTGVSDRAPSVMTGKSIAAALAAGVTRQGGNTAGDVVHGGSTAGGPRQCGNTAGDVVQGGSTAGGASQRGNTAGDVMQGGSTAGGARQGGITWGHGTRPSTLETAGVRRHSLVDVRGGAVAGGERGSVVRSISAGAACAGQGSASWSSGMGSSARAGHPLRPGGRQRKTGGLQAQG